MVDVILGVVLSHDLQTFGLDESRHEGRKIEHGVRVGPGFAGRYGPGRPRGHDVLREVILRHRHIELIKGKNLVGLEFHGWLPYILDRDEKAVIAHVTHFDPDQAGSWACLRASATRVGQGAVKFILLHVGVIALGRQVLALQSSASARRSLDEPEER